MPVTARAARTRADAAARSRFAARDAKAIERILTAIGNDLDKFKRIVGRYFANTDRFFDGHAIPKLESSLAAFIAEPVGQWYDPMPGGTAK